MFLLFKGAEVEPPFPLAPAVVRNLEAILERERRARIARARPYVRLVLAALLCACGAFGADSRLRESAPSQAAVVWPSGPGVVQAHYFDMPFGHMK